MNSSDVRAALAASYRQPEWAIFFEVANGTGANKRRSADAVAVNMYPSRGLTINGFEIKVDKSDWKRELENPDKAEAIAKYCDFWWVAAPKDLIDIKTLPATWGLIEVLENCKTRIKMQPKQLKSVAVNRGFFAALCRAKACADERIVEVLVEERIRRTQGDRQAQITRAVTAKTSAADTIIAQHAAFASAMGRFRKLSHMNEDAIIRGLEMLNDLGILDGYGPLRNLLSAAKTAAKAIKHVETTYLSKESADA